MYFTIKNNYEIKSLNNDNIKKAFENTNLESAIGIFLKKHKTKTINPKTKRLVLIEYLETVDHN